MNIYDLTVNQLRRAAAIKEKIEDLNKELRAILGAPARSRTAPKKKRTASAEARKKIAAAQRARWALALSYDSEALSQICYQGQEENNEPGRQSEVGREVKGLLG